jgi:Flp pilus assembly protein TadD
VSVATTRDDTEPAPLLAKAETQPASLSAAVSAPSVLTRHAQERSTEEIAPAAAAVPDPTQAKAPSCDELLAATQAEPYTDTATAYAALQEGHRQLVLGNWDASQTAYCKATLWKAANASVFLHLAQLVLLRRDGQAAVHWAQHAVTLEPSKNAYELLTDALIRSGKLDEARAARLTAAKISEADETAVNRIIAADLDQAQRAMEALDYAHAELLFRRVLTFRPEHAVATQGVSAALKRLNPDPTKLF